MLTDSDPQVKQNNAFSNLGDSLDSAVAAALTADFLFISYENLKTGGSEIYRVSDLYKDIVKEFMFQPSFSLRVLDFAKNYVVADDRTEFISKMSADAIKSGLAQASNYIVNYRGIDSGDWFELRIAYVNPFHDKDSVIIGLRNVEKDLYNENLRYKTEDMRRTSLLSEMTREYACVDYICFSEDKLDDVAQTFHTSPLMNELLPEWDNEPIFSYRLDMLAKYSGFEPDYPLFYANSRREKILENISSGEAYSFNSRFIVKGKVLYYKLTFIPRFDKSNHLEGMFFGFINVDKEVRRDMESIKDIRSIIRTETEALAAKNESLNILTSGVLELLGSFAESRGTEGDFHIRRIKQFTFILAERVRRSLKSTYQLSQDDANLIASASVLHDIGKIVIPEAILFKAGQLTEEEYDIVKTHTTEGCRLLETMKPFWTPEFAKMADEICRYHHERWDGGGYPYGLSGDDIPIVAQIVAVADCLDALTSERVYNPAFSPEQAIEMILNGDCGEFSPNIKDVIKYCRNELVDYCSSGNSPSSLDLSGISSSFNGRDIPAGDAEINMLRRISQQMPGGFMICTADDKGEILFGNDLLLDYVGCHSWEEFEDFSGGVFKGIVFPDDYDKTVNAIRQRFTEESNQGDHVVFRILSRDKEIRWLDYYGNLVHSKVYGDILYVFLIDITEIVLRQEVDKRAVKLAEDQRKLRQLIESEQTQSEGSLNGLNILLVDDNELSLEMNAELLVDAGAVVTTAVNGSEAVDTVISNPPFDAILMDVVMPVKNGVEAIKEIRFYESQHDIRVPIIAVSADKTDRQVVDCLTVGADDCMGKPLVVSDLSRILIARMKQSFSEIEKRLIDTMRLSRTDSLTGVKNITAYNEKMEELASLIGGESVPGFAIVLCDVNNLKVENDTFGHASGDKYIKNNCYILCHVFDHSPVYRIGGDEFAVVLQGEDFNNRDPLMVRLAEDFAAAETKSNSDNGKASMSFGLAVFDPELDKSPADVVKRADVIMYEMKKRYHRISPSDN